MKNWPTTSKPSSVALPRDHGRLQKHQRPVGVKRWVGIVVLSVCRLLVRLANVFVLKPGTWENPGKFVPFSAPSSGSVRSRSSCRRRSARTVSRGLSATALVAGRGISEAAFVVVPVFVPRLGGAGRADCPEPADKRLVPLTETKSKL